MRKSAENEAELRVRGNSPDTSYCDVLRVWLKARAVPFSDTMELRAAVAGDAHRALMLLA